MIDAREFLKGIFISRLDGSFLFSLKFDENLNEQLLSAFIGALQMFGKESVGNIDEIIIKGWNLEVLIVNKHNLILTVLFTPDMHKENIKGEAEAALDEFYEYYKVKIDADDCACIDDFQGFESVLRDQIRQYFANTTQSGDSDQKSFWKIILDIISKN